MEFLKSVLFGVVEGITEWLPISSTGHMILLQEFVSMGVSQDFWDVFLVVIQLGAILAVVGRYFTALNPFSGKKGAKERRDTWGIWGKIAVGTVPAAVVGLALNDLAEAYLMNGLVVALALIGYGIVFIVIERRRRLKGAGEGCETDGRLEGSGVSGQPRAARPRHLKGEGGKGEIVGSLEGLSLRKAFLIGCFQALAVVPGTSRSGSIIIGSLLLGTTRSVATEFAFFLAIPIMLGWSLLKFLRHGFAYSGEEWAILAIGCVVAFAVSWLCIRFLVNYVRRHDFTAFGWYRIALGACVIAYFALTGQLLAVQA